MVVWLGAVLLSLVVHVQPAEEGVRRAEADRIRALLSADYAALAAMLSDDLTYTHSTAKVDDKQRYLEPLLSGRTRYTSLEPAGVAVRVFGDTAVLTGELRSVAMVAQQESRTHMRFTSVWVRRAERWQMVAWQSTRMPD